MSSEKPTVSSTPAPSAVVPLPVGLYESNGIIFELYRGARAYEPRTIRWELLKTFSVAREGDLTFHVRVSQVHLETQSE